MKNKWLYLSGCFVVPHIILLLGVFFIARNDLEHRTFGLKLCRLSTAVLIIGSLAYYVFFTPITGFD